VRKPKPLSITMLMLRLHLRNLKVENVSFVENRHATAASFVITFSTVVRWVGMDRTFVVSWDVIDCTIVVR
jgi:hypothetical protein